MNIFTQLVIVIGRRTSSGTISMLGTGFFVTNDGKIATSRHVVADNDKDLVVLLPHLDNLNEYQDTSNNKCSPVNVKIEASDPFRDITILKLDGNLRLNVPPLGTFDDAVVGEQVHIFGFPHCVEGRRVLTFQQATVGAKVLLECQGVKSKHAVINTQTRPGQSGSLIYSANKGQVIGMLVGTFAPDSGISLGGINPRELNQTTHCISAEYIKNML